MLIRPPVREIVRVSATVWNHLQSYKTLPRILCKIILPNQLRYHFRADIVNFPDESFSPDKIKNEYSMDFENRESGPWTLCCDCTANSYYQRNNRSVSNKIKARCNQIPRIDIWNDYLRCTESTVHRTRRWSSVCQHASILKWYSERRNFRSAEIGQRIIPIISR